MTQGATVARAFTSDAAGNIIQDSRSGTAYGYTINDAGRIAQLKIGTTVTANYTYDFQSRLSVRQTLAMSPAGTTWSLYDTWDHLVAETDNAGHILREYMWIGDEPVAVIDWTITSGTPVLHLVQTDHLHRPELMTDNSGAVTWKASYEPFGTVASITGSSTENQRFPGQWFQLEAGLAYSRCGLTHREGVLRMHVSGRAFWPASWSISSMGCIKGMTLVSLLRSQIPTLVPSPTAMRTKQKKLVIALLIKISASKGPLKISAEMNY